MNNYVKMEGKKRMTFLNIGTIFFKQNEISYFFILIVR